MQNIFLVLETRKSNLQETKNPEDSGHHDTDAPLEGSCRGRGKLSTLLLCFE